ncbi:MAG: diaminopimelate epimerase [Niabella sp.]
MKLKFFKYQGTGNDFVLVDNREGSYNNLSATVIKDICDRRFGIGADGFMQLNQKEEYDFEMVYYNADGQQGSMCGNGGRCIVQFAKDMGIYKKAYHFLAVDGQHEACIHDEEGLVSLKMKDVKSISKYYNDDVLDTGSPHYVQLTTHVMDLNVVTLGRKIRNNNDFKKDGINVNFVEKKDDHNLIVRTYERGVEDETFACGTGVTAAALVFFQKEDGSNKLEIDVLGGHLSVNYIRHKDGSYTDIWLKGPAKKVFEGEIVL